MGFKGNSSGVGLHLRQSRIGNFTRKICSLYKDFWEFSTPSIGLASNSVFNAPKSALLGAPANPEDPTGTFPGFLRLEKPSGISIQRLPQHFQSHHRPRPFLPGIKTRPNPANSNLTFHGHLHRPQIHKILDQARFESLKPSIFHKKTTPKTSGCRWDTAKFVASEGKKTTLK